MATTANPCMDRMPKSHPKAVAKWIGRQYVESDQLPAENNKLVSEIYESLSETIHELYQEIPVPVKFQKEDPYSDFYDMRETVESEDLFRIYDGHADEHKFFSERTNLEFRAVHDWHGHLKYDVDFSPEGEFKKWYCMCYHSDTTWSHYEKRVLFAEVVGQVGAVHYLNGGFESPRYEQRAFVAPLQWIAEMEMAVH